MARSLLAHMCILGGWGPACVAAPPWLCWGSAILHGMFHDFPFTAFIELFHEVIQYQVVTLAVAHLWTAHFKKTFDDTDKINMKTLAKVIEVIDMINF